MIASASASPRPRSSIAPVKLFFKSPKGLVLIALILLTVIATMVEGPAKVTPGLVAAMATAAAVDLAMLRATRVEWVFPSGALLTGLIIALVLSPTEPIVAPVAASAIAILSKYVFRTRWSNIFNPAALALIAAYFLFGSAESWWGALPNLPVLGIVIPLALGLFIADRINKLPMALAFLAAYFAMFTIAAFLGDPGKVAEVFRVPDVNAALFFTLFMLDDPPTSPVRLGDQCWYGIIVALVGYWVFMAFGVVYFLLAGVLVGNLWETFRRWTERSKARTVAS